MVSRASRETQGDKVSDFTQAQLDQIVKERLDRAKVKHAEQLDAVRAEAKLAGGEITKLRERVAALEPFESQVGELRGQIEKSTRSQLLGSLGIPGDALADIEAIYQSRTTGLDEAPTFAEFLAEDGPGRSVPLLAGYFAGAPSGDGDSSVSLSSPVSLPDLSRGAPASAPRASGTSQADALAFIQSPEFGRLSREQQDEALQAVETQSGTSYASRWLTPRA